MLSELDFQDGNWTEGWTTPDLYPSAENDISAMLRPKGPDPHPNNLTQVKQISTCKLAKYDRTISLKAAAECAPPSYLIILFYLIILYGASFFTNLYETMRNFQILRVGLCSQNAEKKTLGVVDKLF